MYLKILSVNLLSAALLYSASSYSQASQGKLWHGIAREIHYKPNGRDFICVNGKKRFNRALYGSNTAFRAEAGDLPEFALYMPGMGGNLKFGLLVNDSSKWVIDANNITARYRPGSMIYEINDRLLGNGKLSITILPLYDKEGIIVKVEGTKVAANVQLLAVFGGATGKKFSRDGDIGADPESSFYLKPEYCIDNVFSIGSQNAFNLKYGSVKPLTEEERYEIQHNPKKVDSAAKIEPLYKLTGIFPSGALMQLADAVKQQTPLELLSSKQSATPVITGRLNLSENTPQYFYIQKPDSAKDVNYSDLTEIFSKAEAARQKLTERIKVNTPDPYINTLGGALGIAADAIWEDPSFMHGSVAWRMRLNGWRGACVADVLGWHDRARRHFSSYALSQLTSPASAPVVADTALHLARQLEKLGTSVFSRGYISRYPNGDKRPNHYDMNLVFVDQLLNHFKWTGDTGYVKQMWTLLKYHLEWEKRNFDMDGDGLYDAYAAIWASDALQYSGGGVTHSSAYNYRANRAAAEIATIIGEDPSPYLKEAEKILNAVNKHLWIPSTGSYAEYKDLLGLKSVHPSTGIWTIYHALDGNIANPFQAYQALNYINTQIPHIPIKAQGLDDTTLYTLSTTNWQPYTWSLNNVVLAENLHTALAYWQTNRNEEAFKLWRGNIIESMYIGASPGNIQQLSFYDAIRGELYRDFADPIGMAGRSLVEGLFGISPDALHNTLRITPGFPADWDSASLSTPDYKFDFKRSGSTDQYQVDISTGKLLKLVLSVKAKREAIENVTINNIKVNWKIADTSIESPVILINAPAERSYKIDITWKGSSLNKPDYSTKIARGEKFTIKFSKAVVQRIYNPQKNFLNSKLSTNLVSVTATGVGPKTFFIKVKQGDFAWWQPINIELVEPVKIISEHEQADKNLALQIQNNLDRNIVGELSIAGNPSFKLPVRIPAKSLSSHLTVHSKYLISGSNKVIFKQASNKTTSHTIINWNVINGANVNYEKIDLSKYFNDKVTNIFKHEYLSPRPASPTLQLPTQGIGNWAYPFISPEIKDSGLRARAGAKNEFVLEQSIPFSTPSDSFKNNIVFTSLWDNFPDSVTVPLTGKSSHAYFLMAGSTNAMQSRFTNGEININYQDGSIEKLKLNNPENWWPIEQDYYVDNYAFTTDAAKPIRVYLKTGESSRNFSRFSVIKGFTNMAVEGGAATVLDLPLDKNKGLKSVVVKTFANDVIIGLMSLTLVK